MSHHWSVFSVRKMQLKCNAFQNTTKREQYMIQQPTTYIEKQTVTIKVEYNDWHNKICQLQAYFSQELTKVKL